MLFRSVEVAGQAGSNYRLLLHDIIGNQLSSRDFVATTDMNTVSLDLSDYAKGVYMISVQSEDGSQQKTIRLLLQ